MPLTNIAIKSAKAKENPYKLFDCDGTFIQINKSGSMLWRMKYYFHGSEKLIAFGKYPEISLQETREKKFEARKLLDKGINPTQHRKEEKTDAVIAAGNSFSLIVKEWHDTA